MATIKQALESQIARTTDEIAEINSQISVEVDAVKAKFNAELDERYANIKAARSMIALYDKHNKFLDRISVVVEPAKVVKP